MGMERAGVTFASLMSLGPATAVDTAHGWPRARLHVVLDGRDHRPRGVLAARRRRRGRPVARPRHRRARPPAAHPDGGRHGRRHAPGAPPRPRHLLGVGISSPVVTSRWHGVPYGDRPLAQTREYVDPPARVPHRREGRLRRRLLPGEGLPARRAPRRAAPEDRDRRAQPEDARAGRRGGRRRGPQLPARLPRAVVGRAGAQGRRRRRSTPTSTPACASARTASSSPGATSSPTPWSTPTPATSSGPGSATRSPRSGPATPPATARARWRRCPTAWSTPST